MAHCKQTLALTLRLSSPSVLPFSWYEGDNFIPFLFPPFSITSFASLISALDLASCLIGKTESLGGSFHQLPLNPSGTYVDTHCASSVMGDDCPCPKLGTVVTHAMASILFAHSGVLLQSFLLFLLHPGRGTEALLRVSPKHRHSVLEIRLASGHSWSILTFLIHCADLIWVLWFNRL